MPALKEQAGSGSYARSRRSSSLNLFQPPAIPLRVSLQQCPPPLHRPVSECYEATLSADQRRDNAWSRTE